MINGKLAIRLAPWLYTAALFILWEAVVRIFSIPEFFLPAPTAIARAFVEYWSAIYRNSLITLVTTMIGLGSPSASGWR